MILITTLEYMPYIAAPLVGGGLAVLLAWRRMAHVPTRTRLAVTAGTAVLVSAVFLGAAVAFTAAPKDCMCAYNDPSIFRSGAHR